jgi:hypothetical protein
MTKGTRSADHCPAAAAHSSGCALATTCEMGNSDLAVITSQPAGQHCHSPVRRSRQHCPIRGVCSTRLHGMQSFPASLGLA